MALTAKKKAFAEHFHNSNYASQTASAVAAGYSENGARVAGSRLARDPDVLRYIDRLQAIAAGTVKRYTDPLDVLVELMNCDDSKIRLAASSAALPYFHSKKQEDNGKKATKQREAEKATKAGRFATLSKQKIH